MNQITENQLNLIYPNSTKQNRDKYLPYLNQYMEEYEINNAERIAAFLAQIGHESAQLKYSEEIASGSAYEGRKDLGNVFSGDGKKYKGRGLIQITGRTNYQKLTDALGVDFINYPQLLKEPEYAVLSAFWYWKDRRLNLYSTLKESDFKELTRRINGGYNGYSDRLNLWNRAKQVLL